MLLDLSGVDRGTIDGLEQWSSLPRALRTARLPHNANVKGGPFAMKPIF